NHAAQRPITKAAVTIPTIGRRKPSAFSDRSVRENAVDIYSSRFLRSGPTERPARFVSVGAEMRRIHLITDLSEVHSDTGLHRRPYTEAGVCCRARHGFVLVYVGHFHVGFRSHFFLLFGLFFGLI